MCWDSRSRATAALGVGRRQIRRPDRRGGDCHQSRVPARHRRSGCERSVQGFRSQRSMPARPPISPKRSRRSCFSRASTAFGTLLRSCSASTAARCLDVPTTRCARRQQFRRRPAFGSHKNHHGPVVAARTEPARFCVDSRCGLESNGAIYEHAALSSAGFGVRVGLGERLIATGLVAQPLI